MDKSVLQSSCSLTNGSSISLQQSLQDRNSMAHALVASSPDSDPGYQPWKALNEFAMQSEIERTPFEQLVGQLKRFKYQYCTYSYFGIRMCYWDVHCFFLFLVRIRVFNFWWRLRIVAIKIDCRRLLRSSFPIRARIYRLVTLKMNNKNVLQISSFYSTELVKWWGKDISILQIIFDPDLCVQWDDV